MASKSTRCQAALIAALGDAIWIVETYRGRVSASVMPRHEPYPDRACELRRVPRCVRRAAAAHFEAAAAGHVEMVRRIEL